MRTFHLEVDGKFIPHVTRLEITKFYRTESRRTNIDGGLIIDRGKEKVRISALVSYAEPEIIKHLEAAHRKMFFPVVYADIENYWGYLDKCAISPIERNTPFYLYGDRDKGIVQTNTQLLIEEQ